MAKERLAIVRGCGPISIAVSVIKEMSLCPRLIGRLTIKKSLK